MTRFLDLGEYADHLRLKGNEWAQEIRDNFDFVEKQGAEYQELIEALDHAQPDLKGKPDRQLEKLADRHRLLTEIEDDLHKLGFTGDVDDEVHTLAADRVAMDALLREHGIEGEPYDVLSNLLERLDI